MTRPRKNPGTSGIRTRDLPLSRRTPWPLGQRGGARRAGHRRERQWKEMIWQVGDRRAHALSGFVCLFVCMYVCLFLFVENSTIVGLVEHGLFSITGGGTSTSFLSPLFLQAIYFAMLWYVWYVFALKFLKHPSTSSQSNQEISKRKAPSMGNENLKLPPRWPSG